jgi:hypothetical protein
MTPKAAAAAAAAKSRRSLFMDPDIGARRRLHLPRSVNDLLFPGLVVDGILALQSGPPAEKVIRCSTQAVVDVDVGHRQRVGEPTV